MTRLTWLQFRVQAAVSFGALAIVAVVFAVTRPHVVSLYEATVATCKAKGDCEAAVAAFMNTDLGLQIFANVLLLVTPVIIGMFWGAPLIAREFETGTHRLVWTQSVTRTRWLAVKLAVVGIATMLVTGLLSLVVTWWSSPFDRVGDLGQVGNSILTGRFSDLIFGVRNITPIGYAAFAFALGASAGLLIRRTLPAMATAFVGFIAVRTAVSSWVRPHLIAPIQKAVPITTASIFNIMRSPSGLSVSGFATVPGGWVYSTRIVDSAGHAPVPAVLARACHLNGPKGPNIQACLAATYHEVVTYQPASRYWPFQWYEMALFLAIALILSGVCFWRLRSRAS